MTVSLIIVESRSTGVDLDRALAIGKKVWPTLDVAPSDFADFVNRRPAPTDPIPDEVMADLYLACACFHKVPDALRCFRDTYLTVVGLAVKRFDDSTTFAEEVFQRLCEVLFVAKPGADPKIASYQGQGTLAGFVHTSARRLALRMVTSSAHVQGEEALVQQFSVSNEMEMVLLKQQHRDTFNRAVATAIRELSPRDRLILRLNLVERVSTSKIAGMYRVSQPTVSRWIQRAARTIYRTVKELVCDELDIDTRELHSLLVVVRSQIEITISQAGNNSTRSK